MDWPNNAKILPLLNVKCVPLVALSISGSRRKRNEPVATMIVPFFN